MNKRKRSPRRIHVRSDSAEAQEPSPEERGQTSDAPQAFQRAKTVLHTHRYLGRLDPHADEKLGVGERQLDDLSQLPDLLAQASNLAETDPSGVLVQHVEHRGVHLRPTIKNHNNKSTTNNKK